MTYDIALKNGYWDKFPNKTKARGLDLTKLVHDILTNCGVTTCECPKERIYLKSGSYRKGKTGKGLHLNEFIKNILGDCDVVCDCCSSPCVQDYVIHAGRYNAYKKGSCDLYLNKAIRDIMRDCGVACIHCFENPGCNAVSLIGLTTSIGTSITGCDGTQLTI